MFAPRHSARRTAYRARRTVGAVAAAATAAAAAVTGCARSSGDGTSGAPRSADATPATEFLAVAGDSTYWVTSGPAGVRVRTAPLLLTRWGGRLADVYAVDDGVRFEGAEFATVRVYRRDVLRGDSALVLADAEVPRLAARWAAAHPDARPLGEDEDGEDGGGPALVAEHGVSLVAVHGPYLTLDLRTTVDDEGGHRERLRRRVVDLRTGRPASLAALFGAETAGALTAAGRRAFAVARATLDTLRAPTAAAAPDTTEGAARAALPSLRFDAENFGLAAVDGRAAVQFVARGGDADGALTLALPPVAAGAEPAWWTSDVRPLLPGAAPDAARLLARLLGDDGGAAAEQLVRLDRPPADPALRRALRRAFDESAFDDAATTSVARRRSR